MQQRNFKAITLPISSIQVDREGRQRREIDTSDLESSLRLRGLIHPIVVDQLDEDTYRLVAGERRLTAAIRIGWRSIDARLSYSLTPIERQILELEENVKRRDLHWIEEVRAVHRIHQLYSSQNPDQTYEQTADELGMVKGNFGIMMRVAEEVIAENKQVLAAPGYRPAYNFILRRDERMLDSTMNDLLSEEPLTIVVPAAAVFPEAMQDAGPGEVIQLPSQDTTAPESILRGDFLEWAATYSGRPFSFLHCDFPYGINLQKSEQAKSAQWGGYEDQPDVYWTLLECLATNRDRLFTQTAHIMLWLSMEMYEGTHKFFRTHLPDFELFRLPLVWHKTDNRGIVSDVTRRPRNITEFALMGSRGDRKIVKPVGNAYGSPTTKEVHQSEKPEPMLRHFFQMFVDENTRVLDPTCGSGTSLRAAESLGAPHVFGLEMNPDFCEGARTLLKKSRTLRALEKKREQTS
jgi:ParB family chromosome partitioning protein